nr:hypothetical protein [Tanacetum cinerariifolium]
MVGPVEQPYEPTTVKEKLDGKNEMKARGTSLMALPNKDQLKFHSYQDAKLLMEAIEKSTRSTNKADNTAYGVGTAHIQVGGGVRLGGGAWRGGDGDDSEVVTAVVWSGDEDEVWIGLDLHIYKLL